MDSNKLKELHSNKDYDGLCQQWQVYVNQENAEVLGEWDCIYLMNGLYKKTRYQDCLKLYKLFVGWYKDNTALNAKMGWALYNLHIKNKDLSQYDDNTIKQLNFIIDKSEDNLFSPKGKAILLMVDYLIKNKVATKTAYARALEYLNQGKPEMFSRDVFAYKQDGKDRENGSNLEQWYAKKARVLQILEQYEECIKICKEALNTLTDLHYNNDVWFRFRIVKSLLALDKFQEALDYRDYLQKRAKVHWSVYKLLYEMALLHQEDTALELAAKAALLDPGHDLRLNFYKELSEHLYGKGEIKEALLHRYFVCRVKAENDKEKVYPENWETDEELSVLSSKELLQRLKKVWENWLEQNKVFLKGYVDNILSNEISGFIKDDQNNRYYFIFKDIVKNKRNIRLGAKVEYCLEKRFDKKKNAENMCAVNIKVMD